MRCYQCLFGILLFFGANNFTYGQSGHGLINKEPNKCYAKCLVSDLFENVELTLPIYIGYEEDSIELLVFIYEETGEEVFYLADTIDNKDFILETFMTRRLLKKRGFTEWKEVLCGDKVDRHMLSDIADRLRQLDYYHGNIRPSIFDDKLKKALRAYQEANGLPVGQLDFETLDALDIRY